MDNFATPFFYSPKKIIIQGIVIMTLYIVSTSLGLHCRRNDLCTRLDLARKFKAMYRSLGMDLPQCAKFLHVTERTLHNWESGKHDIPMQRSSCCGS